MYESFIAKLAQELDASPQEVSRALDDLRRTVIEEASASGSATISGLGRFVLDDEGIVFQPSESLREVVNTEFQELEPIPIKRSLPDYAEADDSKASTFSDDYIDESTRTGWAESLDPEEEEHPLGVEAPYEDAEFNILDDIEAEVADESAQAGSRSRSSKEQDRDDTPVATGNDDSTKGDLKSTETEAAEEPRVASMIPPNFGVTQYEPPVDSSFVGAVLIAADKPEEGRSAPKKSDRKERPPAAPARTDRGSSWKKALAVSSALVVLLVGGFLLADQTGITDQFAGSPAGAEEPVAEQRTAETENEGAAQDADEPGDETAAELEDEPPTGNEEEAEEVPDEEAANEEVTGPPPIEATAGMWTIVMASEPSVAEAQQQLDNLWPRFEEENFSLDIITSDVNGSTRYRVALGAFSSQEEATEYLETLSDDLPQGSWLLRFDEDI